MSFGERFLARPDLFPARVAGEPWGEGELALGIAGGPFLLSGLHPEQAEALRQRFGPWVGPAAGRPSSEPSAGQPCCRFLRAEPADFLSVPTAGWHYEPDQEPGPRAVRLAGIGLMGLVERSGREGALWTPHCGGEAFLGACENLLRLQLAYRLLGLGGALLHSAGLVERGGASLLLGPSGAGKSTASRLAREAGWGVLSDDLNAVLPAGGGFAVHPLPLTGELAALPATGEPLPLRRLCWLEQGEGPALRPLGPGAAVAALLACAPGVNGDPQALPAATEVLARLAAGQLVEVLTFRRQGNFLALLAS